MSEPKKEKFLTHDKLKISKGRWCSLVQVLQKLEAGELRHVSSWRDFVNFPNGFCMAGFMRQDQCGTVGCIAGWAYMLTGEFKGLVTSGEELELERPLTSGLRDLFYGEDPEIDAHWQADLEKITPAQAAKALSNYLETGKPNWGIAIGKRA